jgi:CHAD domain-containing protein
MDLRKAGRVLGKKRDLDIFSEFVSDVLKDKSDTLPEMNRQMELLQKKILSMLKAKWYVNLRVSLEQLKAAPTKSNILEESIKMIRKAIDKVLEIAPSIDPNTDDKTLHRLRISIKNLRYICEFFEPLLSKYIGAMEAFIEKAKHIQDILGEHQDAITGSAMLMSYQTLFSSADSRRIKHAYEIKKASTRNEFFKIWKDFLLGKDET